MKQAEMLVFSLIGGEIVAILDFFFKRTDEEQTDQINNETQEEPVSDVLLKSYLTGEKITKEKALSIPAVSSAVDKISNSIAMLPIKLYKKTKRENGELDIIEIEDDRRTYLLNIDTGDTLDPYQLKKAVVKDYLMDKGGFIYIDKKFTKFNSIRYVDAEQVFYRKNVDPIFKDAKYIVNGNQYELFEFISILRSTKDGIISKSMVDEVNKVIETAFTTIIYELGLVKKGGGKRGFLQSSKKLSQEAIDKLKSAWKQYYSNSEENIVVLNDGITFKEGANSSVEMQLNERKASLKQDIFDIFHISDDEDKYIKNAVMPIINAIESALNRNFLTEEEKGSFYFAFDIDELERGNPKARYETYKLAKEVGFMSKNEIRLKEKLKSIDGLDVIPLGLSDVLFDINTKTYYTPNTDKKADFKGGDDNEINNQE